MLHLAPAYFYATAAVSTATIVQLVTVQAGELGKLDIAVYKVAGQRNRFFYMVEDTLRTNDFAAYRVSELGDTAEQVFAANWCVTSLEMDKQVAQLQQWAASMQADMKYRAAKPGRFTVSRAAQFAASALAEWFGLLPAQKAA